MRSTLSMALVALASLGCAAVAATDLPLAIAMIAIGLLIAVAATKPVVVLSLVMASAFGYWRVGPAALTLSMADMMLAIAAVISLAWRPWAFHRVRVMFVAALAYLILLLPVLLAHPTGRALFEWAHRFVLVTGAVAVGAVLVRQRGAELALRLYVTAACLIASRAITDAIASGFKESYPFGVQKNVAGVILAMAAIVALLASPQLNMPRLLLDASRVLLLLGLVATQSRGAMLGLAATMGLWGASTVRRRNRGRIVIAVIVLSVIGVTFVNERENDRIARDPNAANFTGEETRKRENEAALDHWRENLVLGAGLRYFNDKPIEAEAHNVIASQLGEGGIVGLLALAVLLAGALRALRGLHGRLATTARLMLLARFLAAMFDIYWVGGSGCIPWVLVGIALAVGDEPVAMPPARDLDRLAVEP